MRWCDALGNTQGKDIDGTRRRADNCVWCAGCGGAGLGAKSQRSLTWGMQYVLSLGSLPGSFRWCPGSQLTAPAPPGGLQAGVDRCQGGRVRIQCGSQPRCRCGSAASVAVPRTVSTRYSPSILQNGTEALRPFSAPRTRVCRCLQRVGPLPRAPHRVAQLPVHPVKGLGLAGQLLLDVGRPKNGLEVHPGLLDLVVSANRNSRQRLAV